jgi:hypothetical protein
MGAAFSVTLAVAFGTLMIEGTGQSGLSAGLKSTARVAYLIFWPAYVGGALATLYGNAFSALASRARDFGLAFASSLLVHVALVIWLISISQKQSFFETAMPFFAVGAIWTYLLALTSVNYARTICSPYFLKVFRSLGVEYITLTFFADFVVLPEHPLRYPMLYVPFWIMLGLGLVLRVGATVQRMHRMASASVP